MIKDKHETKTMKLSLQNNNPNKKAGGNYLEITVASETWKIPDQTTKMTIREAKTLKAFLEKNL